MVRHLPNQCFGLVCAVVVTMVMAFPHGVCAQSDEGDQWLVLNNGQTIEGKVEQESGRYVVQTKSGSRIVIAEDKVSSIAKSIEDVYWDKWSRVDSTSASSHLGLFRWCLKKGLIDKAQQQIELVTKLENLHQQSEALAKMAQELELAINKKKQLLQVAKQREIEKLNIRALPQLEHDQSSAFADAPRIPNMTIDAEGHPVRPEPKFAAKDPVKLVGFDEEVDLEKQQRSKPAWISNRQLDIETRQMPEGTVSFFKRHLQRTLIDRCASCHDARALQMPLSRRSFGQTIPRRMSQQNLHFVIEHVDRANPLDSILLAKATEAHGGQESPSVSQGEKFLFDLKKWTVAVSDNPTKWLMELSSTTANGRASQAPMLEKQIALEKPIDATFSAQQGTSKSAERAKKPEQPTGSQKDPYDPSVFNRK